MVVLETPLVTVVRKEESLNLVKFCDIKEWYSLEEDIHVELIFDLKVKGSSLDWVGIFREDWNTFESFVAFQRGLGKAINPDAPRKRKIIYPFNKDLLNNVLLDYRYQFVYIDRYLDILGTSTLFRFILPLKSLGKESKSVPLYKPYTLSEELLLSENSLGGQNYPSTCRYHRHPMYRNTITTCNHCRPCGHDYYNVKEKAELCYAECLHLSERISNLECEVALHSHKLKENNPKSKNSDNSLNQLLLKESKIKFTDSFRNKTPKVSNVPSQCMNSRESNSTDKTEKALHLNSEGIWKTRSQNMIGEVIFRSKKKDSTRSSSFPQDSATGKQNLLSDNCLGARKCVSDDKITYNEPLYLTDVDSPLILKAIIGHQEERIRRLTQLLNQESIPEETEDQIDDCPEIGNIEREEEVVKLVKTEQRMLAQILRINSNCEEFSNENELTQKKKI